MPGYRQTIPYCYCIAQQRISLLERLPFLALAISTARSNCPGPSSSACSKPAT
jgi:hypothetical protein